MDESNIVTLNVNNFAQITASEGKLVIVDYWAPWCMPCRMIAPILSRLAGEYAEQIIVGKMNIDEQQEFAAARGITSIPTLHIYKDGSLKDEVIGLRQYGDYKALVDKYIQA